MGAKKNSKRKRTSPRYNDVDKDRRRGMELLLWRETFLLEERVGREEKSEEEKNEEGGSEVKHLKVSMFDISGLRACSSSLSPLSAIALTLD